MILRLCALLSLALTGLGFGVPHTHVRSMSAADDATIRAAASSVGRSGIDRTIHWLGHRSGIWSVARGRDGRTIDLTFDDGTHADILPPGSSTVRMGTTNVHSFMQAGAPAGGQALLLEPFAAQLGIGPHAADPEAADLTVAGFKVDALYDANVTVKAMMTLSQYNVIYMHTHSGVNAGGEGVVATGQLANDDSSVAPQLQNGSVIKVGVSGSNDIYYGITSAFIQNYEGQFPHDAFVFLNGCNILKAPTFLAALQNKGIVATISWDKEATAADNYLAAAAFFALMQQGKTIADAVKGVQDAGYGKSTVGGDTATLGYVGDGTDTLQRAGAGQAAAPTATLAPATSTPTVAPKATATPTSVPTATPTATQPPMVAPSLSLALRGKVRPGERQIIKATTAANIPVHFRVVFPDGERTIFDTTSDNAGIAKYVYNQQPSQIAYKRVFATVTVSAGRGAGVSTTTERYRILWGPIDVSVVPREQAVGKKVTIWVHANSRSTVTLHVHLPSGKSVKFPRKTGPSGWAHVLFKIRSQYLMGTAQRIVLVQATMNVGAAVERTANTFTITP